MKTQAFALGFFLWLLIGVSARAQEQFPWPVKPFDQSHEITGNFCEYRSTSPNGHFHNGTDIPKADGSPVYPVKDGTIIAMATSGTPYVRVDDKAYVHINPNPNLQVGDRVYASQTVLGYIKSGAGHVHFTNGYVGSERNSMLMNSGLTPLEDPWPPIIRFVRFYENNTSNELPANGLSGRVDIVVKVDEQNGPPTSRESRLNNGTYRIGYRILSADTSTVIYQPPGGDWRFQFDTKPDNAYVNIVYFRPLSSTTSHVYQVTNEVSRDGYWDTTSLPPGDYVVMVYTQDTRFNGDTVYVRVTVREADTTPPQSPVFRYFVGRESELRFGWTQSPDADLLGYRIYYSFDNQNWTLYRNETDLPAAVTDTSLQITLNRDIYFRITAVDSTPWKNESEPSDVLGASNGSATWGQRILVVDGFDRTDGAWQQAWHSFVYDYGREIVSWGFHFDSAPNESVVDGTVSLTDYDAVFWFVGDEADRLETLSAAEQALLRDYLEAGGHLFINGAHIAWDLDTDGSDSATTADAEFLHQYLKADFLYRGPDERQVNGTDFRVFRDLSFSFGNRAYAVDSTDVIQPVGDSTVVCLRYAGGEAAGVFYRGRFGQSDSVGSVIYLAFPLETVGDEQARSQIIRDVLDAFFDFLVGTPEPASETAPVAFALQPNFPNPFNPRTTIAYQLPVMAEVVLEVYSPLGQKVRTLVHARQPAGRYRVVWDARDDRGRQLPAGIYLLRLKARSPETEFQKVQKMVLVR
ncbi:MAG: hypothetical protein GXO78_09475 [Calditrichaeota bacterium]|nr:hypothetical protein [Calditrichota bacterium]